MSRRSQSPSSDAPLGGSVDEIFDEVLRAVAHAPSCPPPDEPTAGSRWGENGRFVIEQRLGRGGMGAVYLATDSLLARQVALKVLDARETAEGEARKRLLREARLAAALENERVARVYDVGEQGGTMFVAMEYVRGVTLRTWMATPHDPDEVMSVIVQIAEGLAVLHRAGVAHRDLKPENVMLPDSGGVKLLDFGLAGPLPDQPVDRALGLPPIAATVSAFRGTPGYMAPEQYVGERADSRADVFALGILVHELIVGDRPFKGDSVAALEEATSRAVDLSGPPWERFPRELSAVTKRMLAIERDARFADGVEVVHALRDAGAGAHATARLPRARGSRWYVVGAGVVAATAGVIALEGSSPLERSASSRSIGSRHPVPPSDMALIDVGEIVVGQTKEAVAAQCAEIGEKCFGVPATLHTLESQIPATRVKVAPFFLDIHEVTNDEMVQVLTGQLETLYEEPDKNSQVLRYVRFQRGTGPDDTYLVDLDFNPGASGIELLPDHTFRVREGRGKWPVVQVTWFGARFYCAAQGKRLPTENEWEAAARGSESRPFPWGQAAPRCGDVIVPSDGYLTIPGCPPSLSGPVDVMTAKQDVTPDGVHDLGGNAAEWVDTVFSGIGRDHEGAPDLAPDTARVIRGGSFFYSYAAHTSVRNKRPGNTDHFNVGFRCASDAH